MVFCQTKNKCTLCHAEITKAKIVDENNFFCCHGCHAVYQILAVKNQLEGFKENPIYNQAVKSGLISNPDLLAEIEKRSCKIDQEKEKIYLEISNMWCPSCADIISLILLREKGVISCFVDYTTDLAIIEFTQLQISKEMIIKLIERIGYKTQDFENSENKPDTAALYLRFAIAAFCSLNIMMFSYPLYASYFDYDPLEYGRLFAILSLFMSLPVVTFCFWPILKKFSRAISLGMYGMETLVVIGVFSAFGLSLFELIMGSTKVYYDSMAVIVAFVLLGKILESKAKFSAKDSLLRLHMSVPRRIRRCFDDGHMEFVLLKEIKKNDIFAVFQGEKVALDGRVESGEGYLDESLMTGESLPIFKKQGDLVLGGTILQNGSLCVRAESTDQGSALKRIIEMVETGLKSKSHQKQIVDKIVAWFVPCVLGLASLVALFYLLQSDFETAFIRALSIILISCPCAIGIAAPIAESYLMSALASFNIIVRNRSCLPFLGRESVFVFDKTGTITEGKFKVLQGFEKLSTEDCSVLKAMTGQSLHLVALSIFNRISENNFSNSAIYLDQLEEIPGRGLRATFDGIVYHLGSYEFLKLEGIVIMKDGFVRDESIISSKVYFAKNHKHQTTFFLGDTLRLNIKELIFALKPAKTILLSGDSKSTVEEVGKTCQFDEYYAEFSPLQKKELIASLKASGNVVCMVGDGINDAPSLTEASVGISVVSATDISIQVSDILLTSDNLLNLLKIRKLGAFGQSILRQNLFWAFFYNIVGVLLAIFGLLSPIFATFAMMASSLIVLYNAKRLQRI